MTTGIAPKETVRPTLSSPVLAILAIAVVAVIAAVFVTSELRSTAPTELRSDTTSATPACEMPLGIALAEGLPPDIHCG